MPVPCLGRRGKQLDIFHPLAQRADQLRERLARLGIDLLPVRRLHERQHGFDGRCLRRNHPKRNTGTRPRIRVALVVARELLREKRDVVDRAGEQADVIEGARELEHSGARNQAMRRLESVRAAERGRPDGRAVGLAAERERHHAGRHRGRRAARRAPRRVLRVVGVASLSRREVGAFRGDCLAENDRARGTQRLHHCRVVARGASLVQYRAVLGRHVGGVDDVLDADRNAVQGADRLARALALVCRARLLKRVLLVEECPCLHLRFHLATALEAGPHQVLRRECAFADQPRSGGG